MKTVMCFGASMTYGLNPENGKRYAYEERYPGILQSLLGPDYHVIEEGLSGRTVCTEDPIWEYRSGMKALDMLTESHAPIDIIVILLGNNDTKVRLGLTPADIAFSMESMIKWILNSDRGPSGKHPDVVLIAPPLNGTLSGDLLEMYGEESKFKMPVVIQYYKKLAERYSIYFLDASKIVKPSELDGVHLSREGNEILAKAVSEVINGMKCSKEPQGER